MRKYLLLLLLIPFGSLAQTKVVKMSATKSTNYGVEYFLPKTVLIVEADYSRTTKKSGIYAKYAERFLGLDKKSIILEDGVTCTLNKIKMTSSGVPDKREGYLIEFKAKTTMPFVFLTEDGLICTINAEYSPELPKTIAKSTENKTASTVNAQSILTEEYLRAGSTMKMAEVAAKRIYELRESRNDLLTGNADNAPRDGEGMKIVLAQLDAQEKALTELFTGTSITETFNAEFEVEPQMEIEKEVIFRFSKHEGIVDADDLSGSPVYINVKRAEEEMIEMPVDPKKKEKEPASIVYNVPGKAEVEVYFGINLMYRNTFRIVQFGKKQTLATSLFEDRKAPVRIYFYPETGAIKQIIQ
ncbi:MAG: DUF4831 family protein [Dysgonamonadaceae bacterium]|jgi:hypothetical protein|nr:DUF4831 family protein [Dysgonamonadaceae bacterium]